MFAFKAAAIVTLSLLASACGKETARSESASTVANIDTTFAKLNALQRKAVRLPTALARYAYYQDQYEHSSGALHAFIGQVLAASECEMGAYEQAVQTFTQGAPRLRTTPAPLPDATGYVAVDAVDGIAYLARERRIVMVNEAHHVGQTRLLTLALLPKLRALGYTHFAAESLDEHDRDLVTRGYPTVASGAYVREPLYGEIIRTALKLGFIVVPYEATREDADAADREAQQARHLAERVFQVSPQARLFVHAGYAHVHKRAEYLDTEPLAMRLKILTGLDPLSVDQTLLRPIAPSREYAEYRELLRRYPIVKSTIFLRGDRSAAWSLEPEIYDVSVLLPPPAATVAGRPDWLQQDGARQPVKVDASACAGHLPCLVEARLATENDKAVPIDRWLPHAAQEDSVLFLRAGDYRIDTVDARDSALATRRVHVNN